MIRAPSRGTSDKWNNQWTEKWVYPLFWPWQRLLHPRGTNLLDYRRAGVSKGFAPGLSGSQYVHLLWQSTL